LDSDQIRGFESDWIFFGTLAVDRRLGNKRKIFNYDLMNDQLWEEYQKHLDLNIGELNINYELSKHHRGIEDLNKIWALINHAITVQNLYNQPHFIVKI